MVVAQLDCRMITVFASTRKKKSSKDILAGPEHTRV